MFFLFWYIFGNFLFGLIYFKKFQFNNGIIGTWYQSDLSFYFETLLTQQVLSSKKCLSKIIVRKYVLTKLRLSEIICLNLTKVNVCPKTFGQMSLECKYYLEYFLFYKQSDQSDTFDRSHFSSP